MQIAGKEPSRRSDAGDYELRDGSVTHSQCRIVNAKHSQNGMRHRELKASRRLPGPSRLCTKGCDGR